MEDFIGVILISASILGGFGSTAFFAKRILAGLTVDIKDIKAESLLIRQDLHEIRLLLADKYLQKIEVREMIGEVKTDFLRVIDIALKTMQPPSS